MILVCVSGLAGAATKGLHRKAATTANKTGFALSADPAGGRGGGGPAADSGTNVGGPGPGPVAKPGKSLIKPKGPTKIEKKKSDQDDG